MGYRFNLMGERRRWLDVASKRVNIELDIVWAALSRILFVLAGFSALMTVMLLVVRFPIVVGIPVVFFCVWAVVYHVMATDRRIQREKEERIRAEAERIRLAREEMMQRRRSDIHAQLAELHPRIRPEPDTLDIERF